MATESAGTTSAALLRVLAGGWVTQAISICAKLGIADLLQAQPRSCGFLAQSTQTHPRSLYRVLRALASVGIFHEDANRCFGLTPMADHLRTDAPGSLRAFAIMLGEREHWRAWEGLMHSVQTGNSAFEKIFGMSHFEHFERHPQAGAVFDAAMTSRSGPENRAVVAAYDFARTRNVVEVGGGQGSLLQAILHSNRETQGVLFDLDHVAAGARKRMQEAPESSRCEFVAGDFFSDVPGGGDLYILKKVIHDWDDESARVILANCRRAMTAAGRLLLIEPVVPEGNDPSFSKLLDLLMLVWTSGGLERTEAEHRVLLATAGFDLRRVIPTPVGVAILEAVPVQDMLA